MPRKNTASMVASEAAAMTSPIPPTTDRGDTTTLTVAAAVAEPSTPEQKKGSRTSTSKADGDGTGIDDLLLPRTLTSRLARGILPPNTSIQKDALLALTKSATVFISYLASHANEQTSKKTIGPQDVIKAIQEIEMGSVMGFGQVGSDGRIGGRLERELEVYEKVVRGKRKGYRDSVKAKQRDGEVGGDEAEEPETKRARIGRDGDEEMHEGAPDQQKETDENGFTIQQGTSSDSRTRSEMSTSAISQSQSHHIQQQANFFAPPIPQTNGQGQSRSIPPTQPQHPQTANQPEEQDPNDEAAEAEDTYQEEDETEEDQQAVEDDEEDEDEENDEEEAEAEEDDEDDEGARVDDVDGFGPDEQLRSGINGEMDDGGTDEDEESD